MDKITPERYELALQRLSTTIDDIANGDKEPKLSHYDDVRVLLAYAEQNKNSSCKENSSENKNIVAVQSTSEELGRWGSVANLKAWVMTLFLILKTDSIPEPEFLNTVEKLLANDFPELRESTTLEQPESSDME